MSTESANYGVDSQEYTDWYIGKVLENFKIDSDFCIFIGTVPDLTITLDSIDVHPSTVTLKNNPQFGLLDGIKNINISIRPWPKAYL